ncbi:MAG TPA: DUF2066 domain-containing protein [Rhodanobacteraceae bacterium]|nr:DUF2066 domain-containing protein [Rhodanobacteraceae bacterium]
MMRLVAAALLIFLFAHGAWADNAAPASGGYSATVPVADTTDAARDKAIAAAFTQVLSGLAPNTTPTTDVLAQAAGYVRTYRYQRAPGGNGLQLQVDFDPGSIQHLLQQMGASATAANAPASGSSGGAPVAAGGSGTWWIDGIGSAQDFATLLGTLRQSDQLQNVTPIAAQGDGVLLQLSWSASLPDVLNALTASGHFSAAPAHQGADASLHWTH